ncbi:TetR/AcrR family transcriptional regulator [Salinicola endophyticus]|uniref:TetR/AcrR family transcriptional regulator n=1 Tax=Salinicola endophyticus TaxID=1949083 RepID=UPI00165FF263|nr:TetR/AcrR family transcriptional regulator [Salinicola endophyticus]
MSTSTSSVDTPVRPGRPRSAAASAKVTRAALELALEGGLPYATIERIASVSGVAKSTIYRRWPNAGAILMDAFLDVIGPTIAYDDSLPIVANFRRSVAGLSEVLNGPYGRLLQHLLGAAQSDPELSRAFVERWIGPRRQMGREAIEHAVVRGELTADIDPGLSMDLIYGAIYYRLSVSFSEIDREFVETVVMRVLGPYLPEGAS